MVNAEVTQRGTEEDRGNFAAQEQLFVELVRRAFHQLQLVAQLRGQLFADRRVQIRVVQTFHDAHFLNGVAFTGLIQVGFVFIEVINPLNSLPQPIGQVIGAQAIFSSFSTSSITPSDRGCHGRVCS
jgi:hypothetical protein